MICSSCGSENAAAAKFCNECGSSLAAGCSSCGATNKPGAKFCSECGAALSTVATATAPAAPALPTPQAERRLVTVLFADLVGFTPFAEERDAEEVRDTLSRYFELCSEIVARYGGTVEKFIGDAVMAVWGAPVAHEDDAERAVRAALDIVESVGSLTANAKARAGVLTGEAAVTIGATNQGMVAGDLVNTAARLQSVAEPGTVLVGESTYRASGGAIHFQPAGDLTLKGKHAPVSAWRATRVVAELGGRNRSETLEAPFVGRADELRLLKELFHATAREKRIRLVSVMGPAGIGKSRLAWEFSKYTDGLVEDTYWHVGRSPAYGEGVTFWALGEMVRRRCGLVEGDDESITRQKVGETVDWWIEDAAEREWVRRALLALLGFESEMASDQLFAAWRTLFERVALHGTVALIFEDMHFADSGLLDFVDHLLEWSRGLPIFILTLSRPELLDRRPDWGAGKRSFTSIHLEPLNPSEMRELLAGLVPGLSEQAATRIVARADGIPLYAVETVRMLISDGRLREEDGVYVPVDDLDTLAVPDTLTALIASRLDAVEPTDRGLLQDAAVLGQSFAAHTLAAVSGLSVETVEARLRSLARRELLERDVDPLSPERGQYIFVQALIREVAYNTLSRKDRKARHLAAARYFEQHGSDELAGALAGHYLAAFRNATEGGEADALASQARVALKGAAERAAALGSHDQAIAFLEQALEVTRDDADRAEILERAGDSARLAARTEAADRLLREAKDIYLRIGDRIAAARASSTLASSMLLNRHAQAARTWLEQAWAEFGDLWPAPPIVEIKTQLARALEHTEEHERAIRMFDEVLPVAEHANLVRTLAGAFVGKGAALGSVGRSREAIALLDAAERLARDSGFTEIESAALQAGGFLLGEVDARAAYSKFAQGLELARKGGQRAQALMFVNNLGYTGFLTGDWDGALAAIDEVLTADVTASHRIWLLGNALNIRACRGEDVTAGLAEMVSAASDADRDDSGLAIADTEGNFALAQGRLEDAHAAWRVVARLQDAQAPSSLYQAARPMLWARDVEMARRALEELDAIGLHGPIIEVRRATIRAGLAALEGRVGEAQALYRSSVRSWRDLGVVWEEALTGVDMTMLLGAAAEAQIVDNTREILVRLRAQPFLERLDAARNAPAVPPGAVPGVRVAASTA